MGKRKRRKMEYEAKRGRDEKKDKSVPKKYGWGTGDEIVSDTLGEVGVREGIRGAGLYETQIKTTGKKLKE